MLLKRVLDKPVDWPRGYERRARRCVSWEVMGLRPEWRAAFVRRTRMDERREPRVAPRKAPSPATRPEPILWKLRPALNSSL
ncbi:MAG: hypothetical protein ACREUG_03045 [Steroidobacteraceae bacterium]